MERKQNRNNSFYFIVSTLITVAVLTSTVSSVRADSKYNYVSYTEMETLFKNLEQTAKTKSVNIFHLETFGHTYSGVPMYAVKLSDNPEIDDESKPDILFCNGIHGNEWLPSELSIRFIEYMFDHYYDTTASDHQEVVDLINNHEIWIIPILNPDGRNKDEGEIKDGDPEQVTNWRKNVQPVICPEAPDALGLDLNRTFSDGFTGVTPTQGCNTDTYNGEIPFAAPESRWIRSFSNNHMLTLSLEGHSTLQIIFSAGGESANCNFILDQLAELYSRDLPDTRLALQIYPDDIKSPGQYFSWLYNEVAYQGSHDYTSRRAIQSIMIEWGISSVYGCPENGQIGKYQCEDLSNGAHITSSDLIQAYISGYIDMGKYLIKQAETPFAPRNHEDLSVAPPCPENDLALVGSKISEVGSGKPGCLSVDSDGWDILPYGTKQITFNAQNNGRLPADIACTLTICNRSSDPECINPDESSFQEKNVSPYGVKTFTHVTDFTKGKEYVVTIRTVDEGSLLDNDLKRYVFRATSDDTVSTTTTTQPTTTTTISTTTTTTIKWPCPLVAIYGENSEETELLREYRDTVLNKTPEGQETIKTFYKFAPTATKLLEYTPLLKNQAKAFIDSMLPGIKKKVEESNRKQ
jgi:hypothetical protein